MYIDWVARAHKAEREAHAVLAVLEEAPSRIVHLEALAKSLSGAPVDVQDYFGEAISCLENGLFRASIVLGWAGFFHIFSEALFDRHENDIRIRRPKWKFSDLAELKEQIAESQLLDVGKDTGFIGKGKLKILQGKLSLRNQCAHPTLYKPSLNGAIGYVDDLLRDALKHI